jgi:hypothetical protein
MRKVMRLLKKGKAAGIDGIPSDFWKALLCDEKAIEWARILCQTCWAHKAIPEAWHKAVVVPIYKKGNVAEPKNYRPISLLAVGYKLLAAIMLHRLKRAGAEARVRKS